MLDETPLDATRHDPPFVRAVRRLEAESRLDGAVRAVRPLAARVGGQGPVADVLHGKWLGHALHPLMTDLPIGMWTSATVLDLVGGPGSRPAARRLVGLGIASAVPTALTGWAEYGSVEEPRDQRVGVVHAVANVVAVGLYAASYRARGQDHHARGRGLALAAGSVLGLSGYLGGHLTSARKVSTRHPSFEGGR